MKELPKYTHVGIYIPKELTLEDIAKMAFSAGCNLTIKFTKNKKSWSVVIFKRDKKAQ